MADDLEKYKQRVKEKLARLIPIFAKASVGDFSENIEIPDEDDEFAELYVGVQILIEVSRRRMADLQELNINLEKRVAERTAELLTSREQYKTLLDAQNDLGEGMAITEGVKFIYMNDALCQMYGYTREELLALPSMMDIIVPEERDRLIQRMRDRLTGKNLEGENVTRVIRKDGTIIDIEYAAKLITTDGKSQTFAIIREVTERKQAEEKLKVSEEKFRRLLENAPDARVIVDKDGIIRLMNIQTEKTFGFSKSELLGKKVEVLIPSRF